MSSGVDHHTDLYNWKSSVFRRGFPIVYHCTCDDPHGVQCLHVNLRAGKNSNSKFVKEFRIQHGVPVHGWELSYEVSSRKNCILVTLRSPPDAIVGCYGLNVFVDGRNRLSTKFLLFFNPWCREDEVYLEDAAQRKEYINNTHTTIYMGTCGYMTPRGWYLGQFQTLSIEALLMLLEKMPVTDRNSPAKVSRHLSAMVNSNDDRGVVCGNWTGSYKGATSPMAWSGSHSILAKYVKHRAPVRYGQCWVFCGVLCTVLRTCGIPARCITTYNSFHDHDGSMVWEVYFNRFFRQVAFRRQETMWYRDHLLSNRNYHCWNEAWMDRKDLPPGYGGWQIVDATPQERSHGLFKCGPASKAAVKEGLVELPFDTGFVFAEVNADKVFYYQKSNGAFKIGKIDKHVVGRNISTKAVGCSRRDDLTSSYKHSDNSTAEKIIQRRIRSKVRRFGAGSTCGVRVDIGAPACISFKQNCYINFKIVNNNQQHVKTKFRVLITSVNYRGRVGLTLSDELHDAKVAKSATKEFEQMIKEHHINAALLRENYLIKVSVNGIVNDEHFIYSETIFKIQGPNISFRNVPQNMCAKRSYEMEVGVENPFNRPIIAAKIYISGDVVRGGKIKIVAGTIHPNSAFFTTFEIHSKYKGEHHVYATLQSQTVSGFEKNIALTFH